MEVRDDLFIGLEKRAKRNPSSMNRDQFKKLQTVLKTFSVNPTAIIQCEGGGSERVSHSLIDCPSPATSVLRLAVSISSIVAHLAPADNATEQCNGSTEYSGDEGKMTDSADTA